MLYVEIFVDIVGFDVSVSCWMCICFVVFSVMFSLRWVVFDGMQSCSFFVCVFLLVWVGLVFVFVNVNCLFGLFVCSQSVVMLVFLVISSELVKCIFCFWKVVVFIDVMVLKNVFCLIDLVDMVIVFFLGVRILFVLLVCVWGLMLFQMDCVVVLLLRSINIRNVVMCIIFNICV